MLKTLKSEDWVSTLMGGFILVLVIFLPGVMKNHLYMSLVVALLAYLGYLFMGNKDKGGFILSFIVVYALAW